MKNIVIVGGPGSGKSTLAESICEKKGYARIELDALYHKANWQPSEEDEFRDKVKSAMDAAPEGWVVDGGYRSQLNGVVDQEADALLYLNIPRVLCMGRVMMRSTRRILHKELLWGVNHESPKGAWSLLKWIKNSHKKREIQTRLDGQQFEERGLVYKEFHSNNEAHDWVKSL